MPVVPAISYPGVYIQEVPTGSHTIVGVATSITAFIGRTLRGPVNSPMITTSYADFEQTFGGSWSQSYLPDAVRDFYMNGGAQAVIVRLYHSSGQEFPPSMPPVPTVTVTEVPSTTGQGQSATQPAAGGQGQSTGQPGSGTQSSSSSKGQSSTPATSSSKVPAPAPATAPTTSTTNAVLTVGGLTLEARDPGTWGNNLVASTANPDVRDDNDAQSRYGLNKAELFNLIVTDAKSHTTETFRNVTVNQDSAQRVDSVLATSSNLVFVPGSLPQSVTVPSTGQVESGAQIKDDGLQLNSADFLGGEGDTFDLDKKGLYALEKVDLFNLLCIPPYNNDDVDTDVIGTAATYCEQRRAMLILDPPSRWNNKQIVAQEMLDPVKNLGTSSANAMVFFPRLKRAGSWRSYAPSGAIAGIIARTDTQRGVWKAAAGLSATIAGISELSVPLTALENGVLNPLGVNCLRTMPSVGPVVWGARTLQGADILSSDWKYAPVRRLALYIEESLYRATRWAVFEPNDEPLWAQLRLSIGGFMNDLFRQGAFQGPTPKDAYFVQCDSTTTTQTDIDKGIVNIYVGFAPVKPAEFVILYIQPSAGQAAM
ncbi:MAG TPA: phage tail sheath C-terminal domain-containing protein [Ktedonobacteraceae bacterium]|nr:phage tail sheath C-terminal domain-containing protein [Ktedonobacteraceae bacterium]